MLRRLRPHSTRGAELIEMALVTPILLLLVMGIVDFGFMFQRYVVLTNAAVEGARVATMPGYRTTMRRPGRRLRGWGRHSGRRDAGRHAGDAARPGGGNWPACR